MTTAIVVFPWSPLHRPAESPLGNGPKPPPAVSISRRLMRLRAMLMRDEQTRRPPPITLPRLEAGRLTDPRAHEPFPERVPPEPDSKIARPERSPEAAPPRRPPPTIAMVLEAVARHFHVPVSELVGHRRQGGARPLAVNAALALVRAATGTPFVQVEKALDTGRGSAWDATSKIEQIRRTNPYLAHDLAEIEIELCMSREMA